MENRDIFIDSYFLTGRGKKNLAIVKKSIHKEIFFRSSRWDFLYTLILMIIISFNSQEESATIEG